ncbi:MAG: hypothetical protein P8X74_19350 [Reinekea sp.]
MQEKLFRFLGLFAIAYLIFQFLFPIYIMHEQDKQIEALQQQYSNPPEQTNLPTVDVELLCDADYPKINTHDDMAAKYLKCVNPRQFAAFQNYHRATSLILYADQPISLESFPVLPTVKTLGLIGPYWAQAEAQINKARFPKLRHVGCSNCGFDITRLAQTLNLTEVSIGYEKRFSPEPDSHPVFYNLDNLKGSEEPVEVVISPGRYQRFRCDQLMDHASLLTMKIKSRDFTIMNENQANYLSRCYPDYPLVESYMEQSNALLADGKIPEAETLATKAYLANPSNSNALALLFKTASVNNDYCAVVNVFEAKLQSVRSIKEQLAPYRTFYLKALSGFSGPGSYSKDDLEQRKDMKMRALCDDKLFTKIQQAESVAGQMVGGLAYVKISGSRSIAAQTTDFAAKRVLAEKLTTLPLYMDRNNRIWLPASQLPLGEVLFAIVDMKTHRSVDNLDFTGYCGQWSLSSKIDPADSRFRTPITIVGEQDINVVAVSNIENLENFPNCYFELSERPSIGFALNHNIQIYREAM